MRIVELQKIQKKRDVGVTFAHFYGFQLSVLGSWLNSDARPRPGCVPSRASVVEVAPAPQNAMSQLQKVVSPTWFFFLTTHPPTHSHCTALHTRPCICCGVLMWIGMRMRMRIWRKVWSRSTVCVVATCSIFHSNLFSCAYIFSLRVASSAHPCISFWLARFVCFKLSLHCQSHLHHPHHHHYPR